METGVARALYGIESNAYGDDIVASATLRAGITDWLTAEAHAEGGEKLLNGGAGFVARVFDLGVVTAALSGSSSDTGTGAQVYAGFETKIGTVSINGRSQHALGDYEDIASLTARENPVRPDIVGVPGISTGLFSYAPPRAIDSLTLSTPLTFDKATVSATYLRYESGDADTTEIVTASYSRPILETANLHATGYVDLNDADSSGFFLGVSMALDGNVSVSSGLSGRGGDYGAQRIGQQAGDAAARQLGLAHNGSWRTTVHAAATVGYRTSAARLELAFRRMHRACARQRRPMVRSP
jgi:outer membrane usher protein